MLSTNDDGRVYAFGYSPAAVGMMTSRSADVHAAFFLPYLQPGMAVVDLGCGPGSITTGLAEHVSPGLVTGIDIEASQIELGESRAAELGLQNCRFEAASVFELPFADNSVDAVFGHTILMQFADPSLVLEEAKRVLKPGGLIGIRDIDFGGCLYSSEDNAFAIVMSYLSRSVRENDGNPDIGRSLPSLMVDAGFEMIVAKAAIHSSDTLETRREWYGGQKALWEQADFVQEAVAKGWLTKEEREEISQRLEIEAEDHTRFNAVTFVEVVSRSG